MKGPLHDFVFLLLLLLILLGTVSVLALRPLFSDKTATNSYKLNNGQNIHIEPSDTYNNYGITRP